MYKEPHVRMSKKTHVLKTFWYSYPSGICQRLVSWLPSCQNADTFEDAQKQWQKTLDLALQTKWERPPNFDWMQGFVLNPSCPPTWLKDARLKHLAGGPIPKGKLSLVVSFELMRGIEHPFIIDTTNTYGIFSRTSSKLVKIFSNWFLDMIAVSEQLLNDEQHQCQTIMERESRAQIDLSITSLIGEFFNFRFPIYLRN